MTTAEANKALVQRFIDALGAGDVAGCGRVLRRRALLLARVGGRPRGDVGEDEGAPPRRHASPTGRRETVALVADGDRVVHHGHQPMSPTRRPAGVSTCSHLEIWRIENGLIVEHWGGLREYERFQRAARLRPRRGTVGSACHAAAISSSSPTARRATTTTSSTRYECGIVLLGAEVKSIRDGHANLQDGYARVDDGEVWLHGLHVVAVRVLARRDARSGPQAQAAAAPQADRRDHRATAEKGVTLVPLRVYFKDGRAKVELAVARGKAALRQAPGDRRARREAGDGARAQGLRR